ncbi:unnamed protein product, partial [Polarella glacialis]
DSMRSLANGSPTEGGILSPKRISGSEDQMPDAQLSHVHVRQLAPENIPSDIADGDDGADVSVRNETQVESKHQKRGLVSSCMSCLGTKYRSP